MTKMTLSCSSAQHYSVSCHADLILTDENRWPYKLVLASLAGDDASAKAVAAALAEHREVHVNVETDEKNQHNQHTSFHTEGRHRVLFGKTPRDRHTHALVLSRRFLAGEGDLVLAWDGNLEAALGRWLHEQTTLPVLPEWLPTLLKAGTDQRLIQPLRVRSVRPTTVRALHMLKIEEWEVLLSQFVGSGQLAVPDSSEENGTPENESLDSYLAAWGGQLAARVQKAHRPRFITGEARHPRITNLAQPLYDPQADVAEGLARTLEHQSAALGVGEMGVGKTRVAAAAIHRLYHNKPGYRALVVCPKHLLAKWPREVRAIVPEAQCVVLRSGPDVARLRNRRHTTPQRPEWYFLARDTAKLGWYKRPAAHWGEARTPQYATAEVDGEVRRTFIGIERENGWICPDCGGLQRTDEGDPFPQTWLNTPRTDNTACHCGARLWTADNRKLHRFAPAEYIHHHLQGFFDALVPDEVHQLKGGGTAQGMALGSLAASCRHVLALTGTVMGGYASDLFYLAWRLFPQAMREEDLDYRKPSAWVERYGVVERIIRRPANDGEENRMSRGRQQRVNVREKPGVSPLVFSRMLLDQAAFLDLADVAPWLPSYREIPEPVEMNPELRTAYKRLETELLEAVRQALHNGSKRLLGAYLQTLTGYPERPWDWPAVIDPRTEDTVAIPERLPEHELRPKEKRLIEIVRANVARGRGTVVFVQFTGRHDLLARLERILTAERFRVAVLRSDTVPVEEREAWIVAQEKRGTQVLLCHPKLVETGLDLLAWPTCVWMQTGYSIYTLRQASRRAWRIGQTEPVAIHYLVYGDTMQSAALYLISKKLDASEALEGKLSSEGLRALAGEDTTLALAKMLAEGMQGLKTAEDTWRRAAAATTQPLAAQPGTGLRKQTLTDITRHTRIVETVEGKGRHRIYPGQVVFDLDSLLGA